MARIRSKNTRPELAVRRSAHSLGLRFRLHRRDLPGRPDLVFPKYRTVILVHGCFWHRHAGCADCSEPKTRQEYWGPKFDRNVERDAANAAALQAVGWRVLVVWGCETVDRTSLDDRLRGFFGVEDRPELLDYPPSR